MNELSVCIGSACHIKGAYNVVRTFQHMIEENGLNDKIDFKATFCMGECCNPGVAVTFNGERFHVPADEAMSFFKETILPDVK